MNIPASIKRRIGFQKGTMDDVGRSGAQVLMFDDMVLKIQPESNMAGNEHQMMRWLQGKLPVPQIIEEAFVDDTRFLLMSRMPGWYLCDAAILDDQYLLAELVAEGLRQLWAVDITGCPADRTLDQKFKEIEAGLRSGAITMDDARQHRPKEEKVLIHGDYCLPNIFCDGKQLTGFIDLGQAGVADRWVDIEMVNWSMWANSTGQFGGKCRPFDRQLLYDALGMQPDDDKLRYYSLLSELC